MSGTGTPEDPWALKTPPQTSEYEMWLDTVGDTEVIVCKVGKTILHYDKRCLDDLHAMLRAAGDWVELGSADEQKDAKPGTVEAWGRSADNPVGGWYGLKKGLRRSWKSSASPRSSTTHAATAYAPSERLGLGTARSSPRPDRSSPRADRSSPRGAMPPGRRWCGGTSRSRTCRVRRPA
jgi:hypothetical protein